MATPQRNALLSLIEDYKICFASAAGGRVLRDLIHRYGFTRKTTLDPDPYRTAWNEGARSVLVHIGRYIDVDPSTLPEEFSHAQFDDTPLP